MQQVPAAALRKVAEQDPDNALGYYLVAIDKQTRKTCDKDVGEWLTPADHDSNCSVASWQGDAGRSAVAWRRLLSWTMQTVSAHSHISLTFRTVLLQHGHVSPSMLGIAPCHCCAMHVRRRLRAAEPGRAQGAGPGAQGLLHRAGVAEQPGTALMQDCPGHDACPTLCTLVCGAGGPLPACQPMSQKCGCGEERLLTSLPVSTGDGGGYRRDAQRGGPLPRPLCAPLPLPSIPGGYGLTTVHATVPCPSITPFRSGASETL